MRKAAIRLSNATFGGYIDYMKMPVRQFVEMYNEVAEEMQEASRKAKSRRKH